MKLPVVAIVEWHDPHVQAEDPKEAPTYSAAERVSVGFLVQNDAVAVGVAQSADECNGHAAFQDIMWIPRGCVQRVTKVAKVVR